MMTPPLQARLCQTKRAYAKRLNILGGKDYTMNRARFQKGGDFAAAVKDRAGGKVSRSAKNMRKGWFLCPLKAS